MLTKDIIAEIFLYFTVKEISILFRVNTQFNIDVNWKRIIQKEFGINKRYCDTWKDTAELLSQSNMINLGKKWINGKTYRDMFFESLNCSNYFTDLRNQYKIKEYYFPEHVKNSKMAIKLINDKHITLDSFRYFHGIDVNDEKYIEYHISFMTREYIVLCHAHSQYLYTFNFIDPITYVMFYSVIPYNCLRNMALWEYFNLNVEAIDKIRSTFISTGHEVICRNNEASIFMSQSHPPFPIGEDMIDALQSNIVMNSLDRKEDMYRERVKNDYGVHSMYGDSWGKTFHFFSGMNMINLNKKWIDGRTYNELLYSGDIYSSSRYIFPEHVVDIASAQKFVNNTYRCNTDIYDYFESVYKINITSDEEGFKNHLKRVTREFIIISLAIMDMKSDLSKINYEPTPKQQKILNKIKSIFVDPILIITNYTLLSIEDLSDLLTT